MIALRRRALAFAVPCLALAAALSPVASWADDPPAGGAPPPAEKPAPKKGKQKVDGLILAKDLVRSIAFTAKSAREVKEGALDPKAEHAKPFWTELRRMEKGAAAIAAGFKAHDPKAFEAIAEAGETIAALKIALHRTGVSDAKVKEGVATLSHAYASLRKHYGKEALRRKKGGALTEKEQKSLAGLKEKEARLAVRWKALRDQAAAKGHKRVAAELDHLLAEAEGIAKAGVTVEAYFIAFAHVDVIEGEWAAYSYHVPADLREAWHETEVFTETTFAAFDAAYAEEVDAIAVEDWSYLDEDVEVSSDVDFDVEVSDEEVAAEDSFLEDEVHETSAEDYEGETEHEPETEDADDHQEFDDSGGDEGGESDDGE